ncbi:MAG: hypothetical protein R3B41_03320 [Candidatus Doudnabacteria bacterium]
MDSIKNIAQDKKLPSRKNPHLHSANHLLADELSQKLEDPKHFGFYLRMATIVPHPVLQRLCGQVLDSPNVDNKGRLFAYLIKKYNQERKDSKL